MMRKRLKIVSYLIQSSDKGTSFKVERNIIYNFVFYFLHPLGTLPVTFVHVESTPGIHSVVVIIEDTEQKKVDYAVILYYIPPGENNTMKIYWSLFMVVEKNGNYVSSFCSTSQVWADLLWIR